MNMLISSNQNYSGINQTVTSTTVPLISTTATRNGSLTNISVTATPSAEYFLYVIVVIYLIKLYDPHNTHKELRNIFCTI